MGHPVHHVPFAEAIITEIKNLLVMFSVKDV
jgi:hypothetical protein